MLFFVFGLIVQDEILICNSKPLNLQRYILVQESLGCKGNNLDMALQTVMSVITSNSRKYIDDRRNLLNRSPSSRKLLIKNLKNYVLLNAEDPLNLQDWSKVILVQNCSDDASLFALEQQNCSIPSTFSTLVPRIKDPETYIQKNSKILESKYLQQVLKDRLKRLNLIFIENIDFSKSRIVNCSSKKQPELRVLHCNVSKIQLLQEIFSKKPKRTFSDVKRELLRDKDAQMVFWTRIKQFNLGDERAVLLDAKKQQTLNFSNAELYFEPRICEKLPRWI